jgi:hypothetical protein
MPRPAPNYEAGLSLIPPKEELLDPAAVPTPNSRYRTVGVGMLGQAISHQGRGHPLNACAYPLNACAHMPSYAGDSGNGLDIRSIHAKLKQPPVKEIVMEHLEKFKQNECTVRIHSDPDIEKPDWLFGKLAYLSSSRYIVGDEPVTRERLDEIGEMTPEECVRLPLYAYVHGGTALNTTGFSCPWDSAQCGFVYASVKDVKENYGVPFITPEIRRQAEDNLRSDVELFSQWLNGGYGYVVSHIDEDGESEIDSCWGFYDIECCREEAKALANSTHDFANAS